MAGSVVPFARAVYLCDYYIGYGDANLDLYGLFTSIHAEGGFPYRHGRFVVFVQLSNGLGKVPCFIDIRDTSNNELTWTTETRELVFPNRDTIVRLAVTIEGCPFPRPGLYSVAIFCDNQWVCDSVVRLRV